MELSDGRMPVLELYEKLEALEAGGFTREVVYEQEFPILGFRSKTEGRALWVISGIHGEEPAGPNAIARNVNLFLDQQQRGIPVVLLPLCNPRGYSLNWRYPNEKRDWRVGASVGSSEHFLLGEHGEASAREAGPASLEAEALTAWVLKQVKNYPPVLVVDHHEDELLERSYVYSQGKQGAGDRVAQEIIQILKNSGIPLQLEGKTRFDEEIFAGVVGPVCDGSLDELLASEKIIAHGTVVPGPHAPTVVVVETPTVGVSLETRIEAHGEIMKALGRLWDSYCL